MSSAVHRLARVGRFSAIFFGLIFLAACGASSPTSVNTGGKKNPGGNVPMVSLSGGGVKGPLARAPLAFYEFDANTPDFQAPSAVATGTTDDQAAFSGVLVPAPNPPYILVFSANANTVDLTTGTSPVITTMKTVVTQDMLSKGYPIYATPLTTLAVDLAIANANSTQAPYNFTKSAQMVDNFLLALPIAARQVASSLGFGMSSNVDIFRTWPVVGTDGSTEALRVTAEYRTAVEALSTLAYQMAQSVGGGTKADDILKALVGDLGDGVIDGRNGTQPISLLGAAQLNLLQTANPSALTIPNSSVLVGDVEALLASEAIAIGATADTTQLANGTIQVVVQSAQLSADIDGDGVLNVDDAFPTVVEMDTDTDGDGIADIFWRVGNSGVRTGLIDTLNSDPDDDNDGLSDTYEVNVSHTNPLLPDTDGDGILDSVEITPYGSTITLVNMVFKGVDLSGTYTGTGTNPLLADSDNDGVLDGVEVAGAGSVVIISSGANAGTYVGTGTNPLNADTDGDGLSDGAEVDARTNPLVTDSDGDGYSDSTDNCPAVANANQLDSNGDGVGNACSADLNGVWKYTYQPTAMTWNGCDNSLLGKTYTVYQSMTQAAGGALVATDHRGLGMSGGITVATSRFTLDGTGSGTVAQSGAPTVRTINLSARLNLDRTVSGSYVILDTIDGTAVCQESGNVTANFVFKHSVSDGSAYSGIYGLEYVDHAMPLRGALTATKQNSGVMQVAISGSGFEMQDYHSDSNTSVVSSGYDSVTGAFHQSTLHEEVLDLNADGIDDLHRVTSVLSGIIVRAAGDASGATMAFTRNITDSTYFNLSAYDPAVTPNFHVEQRLEGYGRPITPGAYNETLTRPEADGTLLAADRLGLANPPLRMATPGSSLRLEAFAGLDTSGSLLCSTPFDTGLMFVENYPEANAASETLRSGAYGDIACDAGMEGSVLPGSSYTLAVIDDMGTPLDISDDVATSSFLLTAVDTSPAEAVIPTRRDVRVNGAGPSQTQVNQRIAIDGYFNPYEQHTLTWADQGASSYVLRFRDIHPIRGRMENKEFRVTSNTNSATLPAGVINDISFTAFEVTARYDDLQAGTSVRTASQTLMLFPFLNGMLNVETKDPLSGLELNFQVALQRTDYDAALCTVTFSNQPLTCASYHLVAAWNNDIISLLFQDPSGQVNGGAGFYLIFHFTDAVNATVTSGSPAIPYQGAARVVTTELVARNQVQADGTLSTQLTLENPPPLFTVGELTSQSGLVDLDGLGSTLLSLWDDTDANPATDFTAVRNGFWEHPGNNATPPVLATEVSFDSASQVAGSHLLLDGGYRLSLLNHQSQALADAVYAVDVTTASADAVRGPVLADISVNGVSAGAGVGDSVANAMNVGLQSAFDLGWAALASATTQWSIVIRQVDALGQPLPDREWRTPFMDQTVLNFVMPGNWTWTNGGSLDLASYLVVGDVAQVQLVSRDASGSLRGASAPVFVRLGL